MKKLIMAGVVTFGLLIGDTAGAMTEKEMSIRMAEMKVESKAEVCFLKTMWIYTGNFMRNNGGITDEKRKEARVSKGDPDYELFQIGYTSSGSLVKPMKTAFMNCLQSDAS